MTMTVRMKKKRGVERRVDKVLKIQIWFLWTDYELGMRFLCSVPEVRMRLQRAELVVYVTEAAMKRECCFQCCWSWTEKGATGYEPWKNLLRNVLWFYFQ